jgi:transmembrane sensor
MADKHSDFKKFSVDQLICDDSFQRYCLGKGIVDYAYWEKWILNNPHRLADVDGAKRIISILSAKQGKRFDQLDHLRAGIDQLESLKEGILERKEIKGHTIRRTSAIPTFKIISGIAATLLIGLMLYAGYTFNKAKEVFSYDIPAAKILSAGSLDRKSIILADGSVITLRKNSTLRINKDFSKTQRQVWLRGEAFFDIKHDEKHPFKVHTENNDIVVLGTAFNVSAYPGSKIFETSLLRGSVKIIPRTYPYKSIILKPNQKLITKLTNDHVKDVNDLKESKVLMMSTEPNKIKETNWVRSRLDIENESLSQIAGKLQRWYGINIIFEDEQVRTYRYSGVFENENVVKTLEALQLSYPFVFRIENDKITISSK